MSNALTTGLKTYGEVRTKIGVAVAFIVSIAFCIIGWIIVMNKDKHTKQTTGILSNLVCSGNTCTGVILYSVPLTTSTYEAESPSMSPASSMSPSMTSAPSMTPAPSMSPASFMTPAPSMSPASFMTPAPSTTPAPSPSSVTYSFQSTWPENLKLKEGQPMTIYYDPSNPSDAMTGPVPKILGWGFIGCATLIIIISILFLNFFSGLSNQGKAVVGGFQAVGNISALLKKN